MTARQDLPVARTIRATFTLHERHLWMLVALAALVFVPVDLVLALIDDTRGWGDVGWERIAAWTAVATVADATVYTAAIVALASPKRPLPTIAGAYRRTIQLAVPVFALTLVVSAGVLVGLIALLVPGLLLLAWWLLAYQAVALEDAGPLGALRRSRSIVQGDTGRVLGLALAACGTYVLLDYAAWRLATDVVPSRLVAAWLGGAVVDSLFTPLSAALTTVIYRTLAGGAGRAAAADITE